VVIIR